MRLQQMGQSTHKTHALPEGVEDSDDEYHDKEPLQSNAFEVFTEQI